MIIVANRAPCNPFYPVLCCEYRQDSVTCAAKTIHIASSAAWSVTGLGAPCTFLICGFFEEDECAFDLIFF